MNKDQIRKAQLPKFLKELRPEVYLSENYVVFDFETTNRDTGSALHRDNRVVLSTWRLGKHHPHLQSGGSASSHNDVYFAPGFPQELREAIEAADFVVCQNGKFEYQWLSKMGVDIGRVLLYDTLLADYVQSGNRQRPRHLSAIAERHGIEGKQDLVSLLIEGGVCPSDIPERWLVDYGTRDTRITEQVFLAQRKQLASGGLLAVLFTRCLVTPVLADMEMRGIQLDAEAVEAKLNECLQEFGDLEKELFALCGGINLRSSKQVASYLYDTLGFAEKVRRGSGRGKSEEPDRTEAGGRRTDAETISQLQATTVEQRTFQELYKRYRKQAKKLESLEKMSACCREDGGLLYAQYNQSVTQTHRLSSSGKKHRLQFHNFDRTYKPLIKARRDKWKVGEGDGSQLEFRVAAHLGRDAVAARSIRQGDDQHLFSASVINACSQEEVTDEQRTGAKRHTFKPLFGGMSGSKREVEYYKAFRERYKGIYDTQTRWTLEVLKNKKLRTEWGLVFYWPDTKMHESGYIQNTTSIFNYPIQSFATAEIIPVALVYFWHRAKALGLELFLINTIHDSIVAELPDEEEEAFRSLVEVAFTEDVFSYLDKVYGVKFTVPLGAETKVGERWGKGKGRKFDLDPEDFFREAA